MRHRLTFRSSFAATSTAVCFLTSVLFGPHGIAFARTPADLLPVAKPDGRLGLCDILPGAPSPLSGPTWAQLATNAGARTNRWEFRMDKVEPSQGTWNFAATDDVVSNDTSNGIDTEGILIGTPGWAVKAGQKPGNGVPRGLSLPVTSSSNVWADYVRQTVRRYAGRVAFWEVWNEPDLAYFWSGTPEDYFALLKVTASVIHSVDPTAKVVVAGMVMPDLAFADRVFAAAASDPLKAGMHGFFDIAAWHAYGPAKAVYTNLLNMESLLRKHGFSEVPIWVTEAGFPASNPNGETRQAAYVIQTVAYAFAAGADRVLVYRASDDVLPKQWGIIAASGVPRQAYSAFALVAQYLSHVQTVVYNPTPMAERFIFFTPKYRVTVQWARSTTATSSILSTGFASAQRVDWQGNSSVLAAHNGQIRVELPGAVYNKGIDASGTVVGGPPVLTVEDNTRPQFLHSDAYIAVSAGVRRQIVLLNDGASAAAAEVAVPTGAWQRVELRVPAQSIRILDLNDLTGPSFSGLLHITWSGSIAARLVSSDMSISGLNPSRSWTIPASPPTLLISNPTRTDVVAAVNAFGFGGKRRLHASLVVPALSTIRWTAPARLSAHSVSLSITALTGILVTGDSGIEVNAGPANTSSWYMVAPSSRTVVLFNPDVAKSVAVAVRFVGARAVRREDIILRSRHTFSFSSHRARAVMVTATGAISAAYSRSVLPPGSPPSTALSRSTLIVGAAATSALLFNPSSHAVHVSVSIVGRVKTYIVVKTLVPHGETVLRARNTNDPPRGVEVLSDAPIVTAPAL